MRSAVMVIVLVMTDGLSAAPTAPVPIDLSTGGVVANATARPLLAAVTHKYQSRQPPWCRPARTVHPLSTSSRSTSRCRPSRCREGTARHRTRLRVEQPKRSRQQRDLCRRPGAVKVRWPAAPAVLRPKGVCKCRSQMARPPSISVRFGLMPFSAGHLFRRSQRHASSKGGADKEKVDICRAAGTRSSWRWPASTTWMRDADRLRSS